MNITAKNQKIAIENNYLCIAEVVINHAKNNLAEVATIVSNLNYFGFMPSREIFDIFLSMKKEELISFWQKNESVFKSLTKDDKSMSDFMVYKNFPQEVMNMSDTEYFIKQIFIYLGMPYEAIREDESIRPEMNDKITYKVLQLAPDSVFIDIFNSLIVRSNKWTEKQLETAVHLYSEFKPDLDLSSFSFKENGALLSRFAYENMLPIKARNATDVLRMALAWSNISFDTPVNKVKVRTIKRSERRFIISLLESSTTLMNDITLKRKLWKKLFARLNPSDYKAPNCQVAYNELYNKRVKGSESDFKALLKTKSLLAIYEAQRKSSGFYIRNIHLLYKNFGYAALDSVIPLLDKMTISQLVKLEKYLLSENDKNIRIIAPKGNWSKAKLLENNKVKFLKEDLDKFLPNLSKALNEKLSIAYPNGIVLSEETKKIKLPTNDLALDFYGRGTSLDFPKDMKTVRVASYWESGVQANIWFDNGVALLKENGSVSGYCTWNQTSPNLGAFFSGDPLPSNNKTGKACQVIDLDIEKLEKSSIRYVLWSITSYNNLKFSESKEVLATLQFCEDSQKGKIFEPSRCQMAFDIKDDKLSKYVAYLDLKEKKVIFLDSSLPMSTHSITSNRFWIENQFKAMQDYVNSQPSIYDLFKHIENKTIINETELQEDYIVDSDKAFIGYSDEKIVFEISEEDNKQSAYLFKHTREDNNFNEIKVLDILSK